MLASHRLDALGSPSAAHPDWARWLDLAPAPIRRVREAESIEALDDDALSRRFRCWRGRSGRRYIFSVFDAPKCPAYDDAVLIAAVVGDDGTRRPLACEDTGSFPEPLLSRLAGDCSAFAERLEFHVHLLARTAAERREILEDLG